MTYSTTYSTHLPPAPAGPADHSQAVDTAALERWFDQLAADRVHPDFVRGQLLHAGWPESAIPWATERYRGRWPSHPGVWWGGFSAIGFGALSWAGVVHAVIDGAGTAAAAWFGIAIVATAFAIAALVLMSRYRTQWSQTFSPSRRAAASTLFWFTVGVAVIRGITYGTILGLAIFAGERENLGPAMAHVALTAVVAGPLSWWVWTYHRRQTNAPGEDERPVGHTAPPPSRTTA